MASLTGQSIAGSYKDLLQVSNSNSGVDATLRPIEDGEGTASALNVSSGAVATFSSKPYLQYSTADETNYEVLALDKVSSGNGRIRVFKSGTGTYRGFEVQTGGSASLTVASDQNVGIGTTAPETKFTIDQTADDNAIRIYGYDDVSARYGEIFVDSSGYFNIDASTDRGVEIKGHANDFWVNSGADLFVRMTHDSKMGVGTTTPSQVLTVNGNIDLKNSSGFAKIDNSGSLSMADDASVLISDSRNGGQLIIVYDIGSGDGAVFFTAFTTAVTKLSGSGTYDTSDTDGKICVVRNLSGSGNNHDVSVKNRLGDTRNIVITILAGDSY